MRISLRRVGAALLPALICCPGISRGQDYTFLKPVGGVDGAYATSYYAPAYGQGSYYTSDDEQQQAAPANPVNLGSTWNNCETCCDCCCDDIGTWRDNTLLWIGADAYKSIGDSTQPPGPAAGFMDSAGFVGGFNTGFSIGLERVRGQIGASYGIYDLVGRDTASPSSAEQQTFFTAGLYKRSDVLGGDRIAWGLVYDQFWAHQWGLFASELYVGQVRGLIGYAVNEWNEFGVWGTFHTTTDNSVFGHTPPPLRAMNQYNAYWRHNYDFGGQTMLYVGGTDPSNVASWIFGGLGQAPLNDYVSLYGSFTFAFPEAGTGIVGSNDLEWHLGLGLMYSWGGKAVNPTVSGRQGLPLLPVANNGSFLITN